MWEAFKTGDPGKIWDAWSDDVRGVKKNVDQNVERYNREGWDNYGKDVGTAAAGYTTGAVDSVSPHAGDWVAQQWANAGVDVNSVNFKGGRIVGNGSASVLMMAATGGASAWARAGAYTMMAIDAGHVAYAASTGDTNALVAAAVGQVVGAGAGRLMRRKADDIAGDVCFVAGTQVLAAGEGGTTTATNIEDIEVGDWVWSRDEHTGEEGFKPVVHLFRKEADTLVHLTYTTGSAGAPPVSITGTTEHPFWSLTRDGWVAMGELQAGETLLLAGGQTATATSIRTEHLTNPVAVYNFEVADWHTYHVGTEHGWVFVHNLCKVGKRQARSLIRRGVDARDAIRLVRDGKLNGPGVYQFTVGSGSAARTYVGQSANMFRRIKQHLKPGGRLTPDNINSLQTFWPSNRTWWGRRIFEQQHMNHLREQGVALANDINSIAPRFWASFGIRPPGG